MSGGGKTATGAGTMRSAPRYGSVRVGTSGSTGRWG